MAWERRCLWLIVTMGILGAGVLGVNQWAHRSHPSGRPVVRHTPPEIRLILVKKSARCGHFTQTSSVILEDQLKTIGSLYRGWEINGNEENGLTLSKVEEGLCPICGREQFIGIYHDKVAVFYGRPDRRGPVKEVMTLAVGRLPEQEKQDLDKGIVFSDSKEKLQLIEGLSSLQE